MTQESAPDMGMRPVSGMRKNIIRLFKREGATVS